MKHRCEDCGEPARNETADGIWLCDGDFALLVEHWEGMDFDTQSTGPGTTRSAVVAA